MKEEPPQAHARATLYDGDDSLQGELTGVGRRPRLSGGKTTPVIRVVAGPGMLSFAVIPEGGRVVVGRDPSCGLVIDHSSVSRRHAAFALDDQAIVIEDLGSTNGTWQDARRVTSREVVEPGRTIALGQVLIRVERLGAYEIAHLKRMADNIEEAARDPLTKLATRRWLTDEMPDVVGEHEVSGRPLSAIFIDIDHFKSVNDTFGHPAGDEVLRAVGRIVQSAIRGSDVAVRYGGEEMLVVLPETALDIAVRVAERLRRAVEHHPWAKHGIGDRTITVSAGVATMAAGEGVTAWLERADRAMYAAKHGGRNQTRSG